MNKATFDKRVVAFIIDHIIICVLLIPLFIFSTWNDLTQNPEKMLSLIWPFVLIIFFVYCMRDLFGGASIGKRAVGIAVKTLTETEITAFQLIIRQLLTFIWPIEVLVILESKDKRKIGDRIAKTDVYEVAKAKTLPIVIIGVSTLAVFALSLVFGVTSLLKSDDSYKTAIAYIESSEQVKNIVGEITGYGFFIQGDMNVTNGYGRADYRIKIIGEKGTAYAQVKVTKEPDKEWVVFKFDVT